VDISQERWWGKFYPHPVGIGSSVGSGLQRRSCRSCIAFKLSGRIGGETLIYLKPVATSPASLAGFVAKAGPQTPANSF